MEVPVSHEIYKNKGWRRQRAALIPVVIATVATSALLVTSSAAGSSANFGVNDPGQQSIGMTPTHSCADAGFSRIPENVSVNTITDGEHGVMQLTFRPAGEQERLYVIDYRNDTACRTRPDVRRVVDDAVNTWEQNMAEECVWLGEFQRSGNDTIRGVVVDKDALAAHMDQWCTDL
jgi:hypothetical protein